jgi:hypothetical protein
MSTLRPSLKCCFFVKALVEPSTKLSLDGPTSKLPPAAALDASSFDPKDPLVFNTAFFDSDDESDKTDSDTKVNTR